MIFTFTMSDGTTTTVPVKMPKTVTDVWGLQESRFAVIEKGQAEPELYLNVRYSDGAEGTVKVTPDMIVKSDLDFTTAGTYWVEIELNGKLNSYEVVVYDASNPSVSEISLEFDRFLFLKSEVDGEKLPLTNLNWVIRYDNGDEKREPLSDGELEFPDKEWQIGRNVVIARYQNQEEYRRDLSIYICESLDGLLLKWGNLIFADGDTNRIYCKQNESPDLSGIRIWKEYSAEDETYTRIEPLTEDMLSGFDSARLGYQQLELQIGDNYSSLEIFVYDTVETEQGLRLDGDHTFKIVEAGAIPQMRLRYEENRVYIANEYRDLVTENFVEFELTADMLTEKYDFSQTGWMVITVEYNGVQYSIDINLYDPEVTNIRDAYLKDNHHFSVSVGADPEELKQQLLSLQLNVTYYEPVDGQMNETVPVTEEMLDFGKLDFNVAGEQSFWIVYEGYRYECYLSVEVNWEAAEVAYQLICEQGVVLTVGNGPAPVTELTLYKNGFASIDGLTVGWEIEGNALRLTCNGKPHSIVAVDTENNTFGAYAFGGEPTVYKWLISENGTFPLHAYDNGYAVWKILDENEQEIEVQVAYKIEENVMTVFLGEYEYSGEINENNEIYWAP